MGRDGVMVRLNAGANDVGGSLMNESITRAAGAMVGRNGLPAEIETTLLRQDGASRGCARPCMEKHPEERRVQRKQADTLELIRLAMRVQRANSSIRQTLSTSIG